MKRFPLKSTSQKIHKKRIFGFDIETYDDNRGFLLAGIYGTDRYDNEYFKTFFSKEELIKEIKTNVIFRNSELYATNLAFDFFGTFFTEKELMDFHIIDRGSSLLNGKTYFVNDDFSYSNKREGKSKEPRAAISFLDSMNYDKKSVLDIGLFLSDTLKLPGYEKLKSPKFTNKNWKQMSKKDQNYMIEYNKRDCKVTYEYIKYLINAFEELGASVGLTIGSTAMSLFKNKYLGDLVIQPNKVNILRRLFLAFYGGRTECFKRGQFEDVYYYDYNSLYPSVMRDFEFPDPNSQRVSHEDKTNYIEHCEGVSEVEIDIPYMKIPPLPYRTKEGRILFPYGHLRGSWSHIELRNALECGCKITKVYESIYYVRNIRPFLKFVNNLYDLRIVYQHQHNSMEQVIKLLMNNLFGKFGEKFDEKYQLVPKNIATEEQLLDADRVEEYGEKYYKVWKAQDPKAHCIPIWAIYVSAYGRVKMHKTLVAHQDTVIYCDTDSIITPDKLPTSEKLGELKIEHEIKIGCTIRPKMYAIWNKENKEKVKIKGVSIWINKGEGIKQPKLASYNAFSKDFVKDPNVLFKHFTGFKEGMRKGIVVPNEIVDCEKIFSLEDTKRDWKGQVFDTKNLNLQDSDPLKISLGVETSKEPQSVANLKAKRKPTISRGVNNIGLAAPTKK